MITGEVFFSSSYGSPRFTAPSRQPSWRNHGPSSRNGHVRPIDSQRANTRRSFFLRNNVLMSVQTWTLAVLCCLLFFSPNTVNAANIYATSDSLLPRDLLFDRSEPPQPFPQLVARKQNSSTSTTTNNASSTGSSLATATQTGAFTLPKPFDSSIGNNFTSTTCPAFFNTFLSDPAFTRCLPLSLLLQTSNAFFTASRSLLRLTQVLDATCNVDYPTCSNLMASLASSIQQQSVCGPDLKMENPIVMQAYHGFAAYQPLYQAGCLADNSSSSNGGGNYCYANAVTNESSPQSNYIYYLPLGVALPGGARPACTQCLQDTMAIFANAVSGNKALSKDYVPAAQQVQMNCGPTFVQASVQTTSRAAGRIEVQGMWIGMAMAMAVVGAMIG